MVAAQLKIANVNDATTPSLIGRKAGIESHHRTTTRIVGIALRRVHATAAPTKFASGANPPIVEYF
jgi:hypothetical protein